jgi:hypothetical protein
VAQSSIDAFLLETSPFSGELTKELASLVEAELIPRSALM